MSISSDEINFLIYRYLQENGFTHSAFSFSYESLINKSSVAETDVPPGALITFLQKGLEYIGIEENIDEDGSIREFDSNFSLLSPFVCDAVANRDDRRVKRRLQSNNESSSSSEAPTSSSSNNNTSNNSNNTSIKNESSQSDSMEVSTSSASSSPSNNGEKKRDSAGTSMAPLDSNISNINSASSVIINHHPPSLSSSIAISKKENDLRHLSLTGHQGEVFMCVWNPVQSKLASGSADGMCRVWDLCEMNNEEAWNQSEVPGQVKIRTAIMPHADAGERFKDITSISWSPDGQYLATGCYTGEARIWDIKGNLKMILKEHSGPVFSLKWNKQGTFLLSGSYDRRTIIWSPLTGKVIKEFSLHTQPVLDVDWRDGDVFASCSSDMTIQVCRVSSPTNQSLSVLKGHEDEVNAVCWSPGGEYLASCSDDSTAKIWSFHDTSASNAGGDKSNSINNNNAIHGSLLHDLKGHNKEIFTLRWTLTGPHSAHPESPLLLCTASFDGTVKVWEALHGQLIYTLGEHIQPVYSVSPSPYGFFLATGSLGGHVSVWSLLDGSLLHEVKGPGDTFDVSWSADGSLLSACFSSGSLMVQDANSFYHCHSRATGSMSPQILSATTVLSSSSSSSSSIIKQQKHSIELEKEKQQRQLKMVEEEKVVAAVDDENSNINDNNISGHLKDNINNIISGCNGTNGMTNSEDIKNNQYSKIKSENGYNGKGDTSGSSSSSSAPSSSSASIHKSSIETDSFTNDISNSSNSNSSSHQPNDIYNNHNHNHLTSNSSSNSSGDDSDTAAMDEVCVMVTTNENDDDDEDNTHMVIANTLIAENKAETISHTTCNNHHQNNSSAANNNSNNNGARNKIRSDNSEDDENGNNSSANGTTNSTESSSYFLHQ